MNLLPKTTLDNKLHRTMRNKGKKAAEQQQQAQKKTAANASKSVSPMKPKASPVKTPAKNDTPAPKSMMLEKVLGKKDNETPAKPETAGHGASRSQSCSKAR